MRKVLVLCGSHMGTAVLAEMLKRDDVIVSEKMPKIEPISRRFALCERNTGSNKSERKRNRKNRWS